MNPSPYIPPAAVLLALRQGYGVEDIAIQMGATPDAVRRVVAALRRDGILANIKQGRCDRASTRKTIPDAQ